MCQKKSEQTQWYQPTEAKVHCFALCYSCCWVHMSCVRSAYSAHNPTLSPLLCTLLLMLLSTHVLCVGRAYSAHNPTLSPLLCTLLLMLLSTHVLCATCILSTQPHTQSTALHSATHAVEYACPVCDVHTQHTTPHSVHCFALCYSCCWVRMSCVRRAYSAHNPTLSPLLCTLLLMLLSTHVLCATCILSTQPRTQCLLLSDQSISTTNNYRQVTHTFWLVLSIRLITHLQSPWVNLWVNDAVHQPIVARLLHVLLFHY